MSDPIQKFLSKVSTKERVILAGIIKKIISGDTGGLQIKKLVGSKDFFRVRKGDFRIIYRQSKSDCLIIYVDHRSEATYKDF